MSNDHGADLLGAIRALPRPERRRLVEQLKQELADDEPIPSGNPRAIIGMMADEPELMDQVCELAMRARAAVGMRRVDG